MPHPASQLVGGRDLIEIMLKSQRIKSEVLVYDRDMRSYRPLKYHEACFHRQLYEIALSLNLIRFLGIRHPQIISRPSDHQSNQSITRAHTLVLVSRHTPPRPSQRHCAAKTQRPGNASTAIARLSRHHPAHMRAQRPQGARSATLHRAALTRPPAAPPHSVGSLCGS